MFSTRNATQSWDTIHAMLQRCSSLKSTKPVDKVFGLMSISANLNDLRDLVSYNKTSKQLIVEAMTLALSSHGMRCIQEGQWLQYPNFRNAPPECRDTGTSPYFPSWVNIAEQIHTTESAFPLRYRIHEGCLEIAFQQSDASKSYTYKISPLNFPHPDVLRVPCRRIGNVKKVCDLSIRT